MPRPRLLAAALLLVALGAPAPSGWQAAAAPPHAAPLPTGRAHFNMLGGRPHLRVPSEAAAHHHSHRSHIHHPAPEAAGADGKPEEGAEEGAGGGGGRGAREDGDEIDVNAAWGWGGDKVSEVGNADGLADAQGKESEGKGKNKKKGKGKKKDKGKEGGGGGAKTPPTGGGGDGEGNTRPGACGGAPPGLIPFPQPHARRRLLAGGAGEVWGAGTGAEPWQWQNTSEGGSEGAGGLGRAGRQLLGSKATASKATKEVGCNKVKETFPFENSGRGVGGSAGKRSPGDRPLEKCLESVAACGGEATRVARGLKSATALGKIKAGGLQVGGRSHFKSCALVGNAGGVLAKEYGAYVDRHDLVVRFNTLSTSGYEKHVGSKTHVRVLNHKRSVEACCGGGRKGQLGGPGLSTVVLWHPGAQGSMKAKCKAAFPGAQVYGIGKAEASGLADAHRAVRGDLARLGHDGQLGTWRQLTSGGHAVYLFWPICDSISMYGFTSWASGEKGPDQYGGRKGKAGGESWHDWGGEALAWRLLHAHGKLSVCSL